jgi:PIN domain nuclease of toxin-antitoxin system
VKVLLDTHAFLWWFTDDRQLSSRARRILGDGSNEVYFSAASGWEIAIKTRLGRLSVVGDNLEDFVAEHVAANGFEVLPIHLNHALRTYSLPDYHRDPSDRLLIAQALIEELTLLTADRKLSDYKVRIVW